MFDKNRQQRSVEAETVQGAIRGLLLVSDRLRTLDDLNVVAKNFVTVHSPQPATDLNFPDDGPLAINKSCILFLRELTPMPPRSGVGGFGKFAKAPVRLQVGSFEIHGFVHVPPGGQALKRFEQNGHPFISVTSALVTGTSTEFNSEFLAVNRAHVVTAQQLTVTESVAVPDSLAVPADTLSQD